MVPMVLCKPSRPWLKMWQKSMLSLTLQAEAATRLGINFRDFFPPSSFWSLAAWIEHGPCLQYTKTKGRSCYMSGIDVYLDRQTEVPARMSLVSQTSGIHAMLPLPIHTYKQSQTWWWAGLGMGLHDNNVQNKLWESSEMAHPRGGKTPSSHSHSSIVQFASFHSTPLAGTGYLQQEG